ncbi:MAG: glycosyltransferase family 2 protein [Bacteroidia bacterium]|nr:glycosyltransferase family 2 protein [Bacteroidia bacterium]
MILNKTIAVVMPAYNAAETLEITLNEVPRDIVDYIILVDDNSKDETSKVAANLNIQYVIKHDVNKGYGGNQKTCYNKALEINADIVVMLHPDYQYTPKLIHSMCYLIANEVYPVVFGSRILGVGAVKGGMPIYKYVANRFLTLFQNIVLWKKLSEYHTGYRAFSTDVLRNINYQSNSDDFIFDNEFIAQIFSAGYEIAEITCPTKYFEEASSISFLRSVKYGLGVLKVTIQYRLHKWRILNYKLLKR